jgi:sugar O-acyltransferase (sialic acid O-acetyltransferase NeuD family)
MILFGVSNMLSDIYECLNLLGKKVTTIVVNVPELKRERTKEFETRLKELRERPLIMSLEKFTPQKGKEYFVVPTTARKCSLVEFLKKTYQLKFSQLIHPSAYVSPYAKIGQNVFIGANSVIGPGCVIKDHVFINHGVTVGHDTVLHDYVRLNPGCNIAGHVEIFENAIICLGANVIEELVIGKGAVVAAGAVVLKDVKERTLVAGVPAIVKKVYNRRGSDIGLIRNNQNYIPSHCT